MFDLIVLLILAVSALVGFLRGPSMNIYTGPQRITTPAG